MPRLLFVHNHLARFVEIDRDLLKERWEVVEWHQKGRWVDLGALWKAVGEADLVVGWFASWHTFFPITFAKLQRKPSLLIIGGYDVAKLPLINYGHQRGGIKQLVSRWAMHQATRLMTNSHYSHREIQANVGLPADRVVVVPHGVPDPFGKLPDASKQDMALTVGNVNVSNLTRKGHQAFAKAAHQLPLVTFVLAGKWQDDVIDQLKQNAAANLIFTGWVDDGMLLRYYQDAKVYVQASQHEGFGLSVAEAMLAGCIPVVTRAGALPEVVGDAGIVIDDDSPKAIATGIIQALSLGQEAAQKARFQILTHFGLERRRQALFHLIEELLPQTSGVPH